MTIRLSGMQSGLDTDALVKELSKAYSKKTDTYKGEQTKLQWKTDIWSDLNKKVKSFYSKLSNFRFSSAYNLKKTTVSNATKATVTATNSAVNGTQNLNITSLAKTGYLTGGQLKTTSGASVSTSTTLRELGMTDDDSGKVNLNGNELVFNSTDTVNDVVNKLKNAGVNASFDEKNQRIFVSSKKSGAANDFTLTANDSAGSKALAKLGLLVGSETSSKLNGQFIALKQGDDESEADYRTRLAGVLEDYNDAASVSSRAATAASNISQAKQYLEAATNKKNLEDLFKGGDYTDTAGNTIFENENDVALLNTDPTDKAIIDGELYTRATGEDGTITYTNDNNGSVLTVGTDDFEAQTIDQYLASKYSYETTTGDGDEQVTTRVGMTETDLAAYRSAVAKVDEFQTAASAEDSSALTDYTYEDSEGASHKIDYSQMSLASLMNQIDAAIEGGDSSIPDDLNVMASDATIGKNAAATYLSENSYIKSYAEGYASASDDDGRALAIGDLISRIEFADTQGTEYSEGATRVDATDATIYLNGAKFTGDSNTFSINGLTINATGITMTQDEYDDASDSARESSSISITTSTDAQGVYDSIKDLFGEYNTMINELTSYYNADSAKGYSVLTDDEKDAMSDTEVEKWNDKIKSSLLRSDSTLGSLISAFTSTLSAQYKVGDKNYSLASFGIQTLGYSASEKNQYNAYHIYGDEDDDDVSSKDDKLLAMINDDPEAAAGFFQQMFGKLYTTLTDKMSATTLSSSMTIYNDKEMAKEYSNWTKTISSWEDKVADIEDSYYSKFAAMEKALTQLESSTSALTSLFGG